MILSDLKVTNVRNIRSFDVTLHPKLNFIIGPNGSGKTSILEALYLLCCGHSFRSREISPTISYGEKILTVFGRALDQSTVSIQKSLSDPTQIKINNQFCSTTSQLAYALPCQIFYSDLFQIIDSGPSVRRSVLDWGLFHVKPEFLILWKEYKKVLKQRNALLKNHAPYTHFVPWDKQLCDLATQLHLLRDQYVEELLEVFYRVLNQLSNTRCVIKYYKGWDKKNSGKNLREVLQDCFIADTQKQYTQFGAHQADLLIESADIRAKFVLSRGQQKIVLIALKLAQGSLLKGDCLYLFDDVTVELDQNHITHLFDYLISNVGQYVITGVNDIESFFNRSGVNGRKFLAPFC